MHLTKEQKRCLPAVSMYLVFDLSSSDKKAFARNSQTSCSCTKRIGHKFVVEYILFFVFNTLVVTKFKFCHAGLFHSPNVSQCNFVFSNCCSARCAVISGCPETRWGDGGGSTSPRVPMAIREHNTGWWAALMLHLLYLWPVERRIQEGWKGVSRYQVISFLSQESFMSCRTCTCRSIVDKSKCISP